MVWGGMVWGGMVWGGMVWGGMVPWGRLCSKSYFDQTHVSHAAVLEHSVEHHVVFQRLANEAHPVVGDDRSAVLVVREREVREAGAGFLLDSRVQRVSDHRYYNQVDRPHVRHRPRQGWLCAKVAQYPTRARLQLRASFLGLRRGS